MDRLEEIKTELYKSGRILPWDETIWLVAEVEQLRMNFAEAKQAYEETRASLERLRDEQTYTCLRIEDARTVINALMNCDCGMDDMGAAMRWLEGKP